MSDKHYTDQRSEPRVPIRPLHHVAFSWKNQGKTHLIEISNISRKGIGFLRSESAPLPSSGVIEGTLSIAGKEFVVHPEIVFSNDRAAGCRLTDSRPEIDDAVEDYFAAELVALRLVRPEDTRYTCEDYQELKIWEGTNNCEVLLLLEGNSLIRFKITFFGNVFDGGEKRPLTVGEIIQNNDFDDFSAGGKMVLTKPVVELDATTRQAALRFVDTMEDVDPAKKEIISRAIENFPAMN